MIKKNPEHTRTRVIIVCFDLLFLAIIGCLFYWQVVRHGTLQAEAEQQYTRVVPISTHRGKILTDDGYTLADNQVVYRVFAQPNVVQGQSSQISQALASLLAADDNPATDAATLKMNEDQWRSDLQAKLADPQVKWIALKNKINEDTKQKIAALNFNGIGFDSYEVRAYPEASMAAHVTG